MELPIWKSERLEASCDHDRESSNQLSAAAVYLLLEREGTATMQVLVLDGGQQAIWWLGGTRRRRGACAGRRKAQNEWVSERTSAAVGSHCATVLRAQRKSPFVNSVKLSKRTGT